MIWLGVGLAAAVGYWVYRCWWFASDRRPVTPRWLVTNDRREWRQGVEQSTIKAWPIRRPGDHP